MSTAFVDQEVGQPPQALAENAAPDVGGQQQQHQQQQPALFYGWLNFRPQFLQRFLSSKWALFWLCWAGAMQGLVVNGCINVVITTIERRFGLSSSQTGLVSSGYDIASFLCLVPVTYFGGRAGASKPRWIGWGVVIMGLGSLTFALPHLLVGAYRATTATGSNVCASAAAATATATFGGNGTSADDLKAAVDDALLAGENLSWNVWLFFGAQLLHGAGASPLFTLGVTYIDENVSKRMSSVYLGIYYMMAIIGPAVGYVIGGQLLRIYVDAWHTDAVTLGLTTDSKVWVGAWWIIFIFVFILCVLLAAPILAYPSSLPGAAELQQAKVSEAHDTNANSCESPAATQPNANCVVVFMQSLWLLLRNPTFFFLNLGAASEGLVVAGFAAFMPKLIENQFSVTAMWSAMLMGVITVPAGGGGTFLGGYLVKRFNLRCAEIIRMSLLATVAATLFTGCFFLSCPNLAFAGVTQPYNGQLDQSGPAFDETSSVLALTASASPSASQVLMSSSSSSAAHKYAYSLDSACNRKCDCSRRQYDPICGADGVMYYSPCHAGCTNELSMDGAKVYLDCDCVDAPQAADANAMPAYRGYDAINTACTSGCTRNLWLFVLLCFFVMFFTFLSTMPALSATLRCVHDDQRSFALGIQWIMVRLLGTIPAPLLFGRLIDETCILWGDGGACLVYDNDYISKYMLVLAVTAKLCSVVFFFGAWWLYIPPKNTAGSETKAEKHDEMIVLSNQGTVMKSTVTETDRY